MPDVQEGIFIPNVPAWESRIVGTDRVDPNRLTGNAKNMRRHPQAQRRIFDAMAQEVGLVAPILVNKRTGKIIDGHMRAEEAKHNGTALVDVVYVDLDEAEEAIILATFDAIGQEATGDRVLFEALAARVGAHTTSPLMTQLMQMQVARFTTVEPTIREGMEVDHTVAIQEAEAELSSVRTMAFIMDEEEYAWALGWMAARMERKEYVDTFQVLIDLLETWEAGHGEAG